MKLRPSLPLPLLAALGKPDWTVPAVVGVLAAIGSLSQLGDWDTFHHLAYGRDIVRRHGFSPEDPFLYPLEGQPSGAQPSWLGSLVIYLTWVAAGDAGPTLLTSLLAGALFFLLSRDAVRGETSPAGFAVALLPLSIAFVLFRERAVARPELFAYVFLAAILLCLNAGEPARRKLLWAFPAIAVLWVNLHNSVLSGFAILGLFVAVEGARILGARAGWPVAIDVTPPELLGASLSGAISVAATSVLNPSGASLYRQAIGLVASLFGRATPGAVPGGTGLPGLSILTKAVDELRPPDSTYWTGPFGWLVLLTVLSFVLAGSRGRARDAVVALAFVLLAGSARRFVALAAIVLAPIAARTLRVALERRAVFRGQLAKTALIVLASGLTVFCLGTRFGRPEVRWGLGMSPDLPRRTVEYLRALGKYGRIFNTFQYGGLLEWSLDGKVFQDGRGDLRPADAHAAMAGPSSYSLFRRLDEKYRFDVLFVHYPQFDGEAFAKRASTYGEDWGADRQQWALVAFDDWAQVYLRRDGRFSDNASRDEYRFVMPANSLMTGRMGSPETLLDESARSLREAPYCLRCRTMKGYVLMDAGRDDEAAEALEAPARDADPEMRLYARAGLASIAERRKDWRRAASEWEWIVEAAPDPSWSRRKLASVLLREGRVGTAWGVIRKNLSERSESVEDLELGLQIAEAGGKRSSVAEISRRLDRGRRADASVRLLKAGNAAVAQGRLGDAIRAFEEAARLNPGDARPYADLGYALLVAGDIQGAEREVRRAIELQRGWGFPHFILARSREAVGDVRGAEAEYRTALKLGGAEAWADEARLRLAALPGRTR